MVGFGEVHLRTWTGEMGGGGGRMKGGLGGALPRIGILRGERRRSWGSLANIGILFSALLLDSRLPEFETERTKH